ncbi:hypothetical protein ACFYSC_23900 [Streptosporangium sp. NPDC004379]|uniref:hypothetical protein n=1 Tax=Streptosporangium sp. NPDC004379 TaxID=3366189 RepID=UPI00369F286A
MTHEERPTGPAGGRAPSGPSEDRTAPDVDDVTAEALGKLSEALETTERARGHLYSFHQLTGHADFQLDEAVELLRAAGHTELADTLSEELIGRDVLPGHWSFQIVEGYDDSYYRLFTDLERRIRERLAGGRRHIHEARLRERRRTPAPRSGG